MERSLPRFQRDQTRQDGWLFTTGLFALPLLGERAGGEGGPLFLNHDEKMRLKPPAPPNGLPNLRRNRHPDAITQEGVTLDRNAFGNTFWQRQLDMRHLFILCALLAGFAITSRSELAIFDGKTTTQSIRPGFEFKFAAKEFFIWNLISNNATVVSYTTISGQKVYNVFGGALDATSVTGQSGRSYVVFSAISNTNEFFDALILRGQTAVVRQRSNAAIYFPRTIKGVSRALNISAGPRFSESSHSYVFSQKRTVGANDLGLTELQVVNNLINELRSKGYRDIREFSSSARSSVAAMNVTVQALWPRGARQ